MDPLKVVFMGTPDIAVPALSSLIVAGHDIVCVYSQPPRPAGRGQRDRPSPVQKFATAHGIEVRYPTSLKDSSAQTDFAALNPDIAVVIAYGLILPAAILRTPRLGCLNIHMSLLPRWRGAAPIQRAIMAGDQQTGVTVMQMDEGLDTGAILVDETVPILPTTTAGDLHDTLADIGARLIVDALRDLVASTITPRPQTEEGVTYAHKLGPEDQKVDWTRSAREVDCQIRGLSPFPGAWCEWTPPGETSPIRWQVPPLALSFSIKVTSAGARSSSGRAEAAPSASSLPTIRWAVSASRMQWASRSPVRFVLRTSCHSSSLIIA